MCYQFISNVCSVWMCVGVAMLERKSNSTQSPNKPSNLEEGERKSDCPGTPIYVHVSNQSIQVSIISPY